MIRILHGSDVHFGAPFLAAPAEAFAEAARALGPDVVVVSGDLTQRAKPSEYRAAREYLDRLPSVPLVVTPGNHDVPLYRIWERIAAPFRNYRQYISDELDTITRIEGATLVSLNSAAPRTAIVNGRLSRTQLDFADRAFSASPSDDARILVVHHNMVPAPDYETDPTLPGSGRILDQLEDMGVELVLSGHLHRSFISSSLDARPRPDRDQGLLLVHSGTTSSRRGRARERGRQSFNLLTLGAETVDVHQYRFSPEAGRFVLNQEHRVHRGPGVRGARHDPRLPESPDPVEDPVPRMEAAAGSDEPAPQVSGPHGRGPS